MEEKSQDKSETALTSGEASSSKDTNRIAEKIVQNKNEEFLKIYNVFKQEYIILAEYKMVQAENIHGVYVIPSRETPLVWFGVIFVRSGPYEEGVFRFTLFLDGNFPNSSHPRIVFHSNVFHPVINPETNELNLSKAFPTWNKKENHLWQVLKYIYWAFNNPDASLAHGVNEEACEMLSKNKPDFIAKVKEIVKNSHSTVYSEPATEDKHYIAFAPYTAEVHDKKKLVSTLTPKENFKKGHSWVLPKKFRPLERVDSAETPNVEN